MSSLQSSKTRFSPNLECEAFKGVNKRELFEFFTYCELKSEPMKFSEEFEEMRKSVESLKSSMVGGKK